MPSVIPRVPIQLDRPRTLYLSNWARCQAERELCDFWAKDMSIYDALTTTPIRLNDLAIILWQSLLHEDQTLTLRQTYDLMDCATQEMLFDALLRAWNVATPAAEPPTNGEAPDPLALSASTGAHSGPSVVLS